MKIWKAELILIYNTNDEWEAVFSFESDGRDYKANKDTREWTNWEGWIGHRIPMDIKIDRTYSGELKIVQGFDRELSSNVLSALEQEMRKVMAFNLNTEKLCMIDKYENKINVVLKIKE